MQGSETYHGPFKRDVYHGYGEYRANTIFREPWGYDGKFNINNMEGYGTLSYADGSFYSVRTTLLLFLTRVLS